MKILGAVVLLILCSGFPNKATAKNLTDNGNGTVLDIDTGLVWQQAEGGSMAWENSLTYCEALSLDGQSDWRLPDVRELISLVDRTIYNPALDRSYFPEVVPSWYWSSTTAVVGSSYYAAWYVDFYSGHVYSSDENYDYKSSNISVRCVRGGK